MAAAVGIFAAGLGVMSSVQQSRAEAQALEEQAKASERNAKLQQEETAEELRRQSIIARKTIGQARANFGAAGINIEGSSALDVMSESMANAELDRAWIKYSGTQQYNQYKLDADFARNGAKAARDNAWWGGAAGILTGGQKILQSDSSGSRSSNSGSSTKMRRIS